MIIHSCRLSWNTVRATMFHIKTFAFVDLETTGLPSLEYNRTRLTELSLVVVQAEHLSLGVVPRVQNKLTLCFNPQKRVSIEAENITGLSNMVLEHLSSFNNVTVQTINSFLDHNPKPICLVAHNGNKFDFPILRAEVQKTGLNLIEDLLCVDSLVAFRYLHDKSQEINSAVQTEVETLPIELQDGYDELLCKALDDFENCQSNSNSESSIEMQKSNEKTPTKQIKLSPTLNILNKDEVKETENVLTKVLHSPVKKCANWKTGDTFEIPKCNPKSALELQRLDEQTPQKQIKSSIFNQIVKNEVKQTVKECSKLGNFPAKKRLRYNVSFKLTDVFERLTKQEAIDAHQAEKDTEMLVMCAATLGEDFVDWANENAKKFCDMPIMSPGKKLGS